MIEPYLPGIWLFIIGFFLLYYAVTDGFDLGVGIISLISRNDAERALLMGSLSSIWHINQTWLVILGGMLFGAFPLFYGLVLSSLYIPIFIMLFGLILRGVAFEFRDCSYNKLIWGLSFGAGSLLASAAQGFALGGLLGGLEIIDGQFVGSAWSWLNPFSALVSAGVVFGYTMLGANYLILTTREELQQRSYRCSLVASSFTLVISLSVHLWIIARYPHVVEKWTIMPDLFYVGVFPFLALFAFVMFFRSLRMRSGNAPLLWNIAIILFAFVGLSVGLYPNMIPNVVSHPVTVKQAAASPGTLLFMLIVTAVLIPVILTYTAFTYRLISGRAGTEEYERDSQ